MTTYRPANRSMQWFGDKFSSASFTPDRVVLHSTETPGWPSYDGGAKAPSYTVKPDIANRGAFWRAHFEDEESARALANLSGGVETNTKRAIQVEMIGTCDPAKRSTWPGTSLRAGVHYLYLPDAPVWWWEEMALFAADMKRRHGIPLTSRVEAWRPYPDSYGATSSRLTGTEWNAFTGWCGHQHVPENNHGDPGNIPIGALLSRAAALLAPPPPPPPEEKDVPLTTDDVRTIMDADIIPAPPGHATESNPFWTVGNMLRETFKNAEGGNVKALAAKTAAESAAAAALDAAAAAKDAAAAAKAAADKLQELIDGTGEPEL